MRRRLWVCLVSLALLAGLMGCSNSGPGGPSVSDRATRLAQTAAALLTSTAAASVTPETATPPPTAAPVATSSATPSPVPATPTALPATSTLAPCATNKDEFVSDVNVPDGTHFAAGATFQKTWRLRNTGDCAWTTDYTLRNVGGETMGGATINLPNGVPPGATVDLTVTFVAPDAPGPHTSHWQMFTPAGVAFGTKPFIQINVR